MQLVHILVVAGEVVLVQPVLERAVGALLVLGDVVRDEAGRDARQVPVLQLRGGFGVGFAPLPGRDPGGAANP